MAAPSRIFFLWVSLILPTTTLHAQQAADRVWFSPGDNWVTAGAVSPDGRAIAFIDWGGIQRPGFDANGSLVVHDTYTDEYRVVARSPDPEEDTYVVGSIWSRDSEQIAYAIWDDSWEHQNLHVVRRDGSDDRQITENQQHAEILPGAWSSDGDFIVAFIIGWDEIRRLALVSVPDGEVSILKTLGREVSPNALSLSLSPDNRFVAYSYPSDNGDRGEVFVLAIDGSVEEQIATSPAYDYAPYWMPGNDRLLFMSNREGRTGIWSVDLAEGSAVSTPQLVRPDIDPAFVPLGISNNGKLIFRSDVSESELFIGEFNWGSGSFIEDPVLLTDRFPGSNSVASWSPDGTRLAYLSQRLEASSGATSFLVVKSLSDGKEWDIALPVRLTNESRPEWSADGTYVLLNGYYSDPTNPTLAGRAAYRVLLESGEISREPYIRDYAGFFGTSSARFITGRQGEALRSLGIRISGQRDFSMYADGDEPLRTDEKLLWARYGVRWVRSMDCSDLDAFPQSTCQAERTVETIAGESPMPAWELSPDASTLAFVSGEGDRVATDLWLWTLTGGEAKRRLHFENDESISAVRWSPDGSHLLIAVDKGDQPTQIYRLPTFADGLDPVSLPFDHVQLGESTLQPDGPGIVFPVSSSGLEVWTLTIK
jgi:Tol biopolymer transport system component